jgi:Mg-chelatase subunit ChlD
MKHQKALSKTFCLGLVVLAFLAPHDLTRAAPSKLETTSIIQSELPSIEVMFVLDTTGSMSGLIAAAKEKIWSIANTLASADPAPAIKMGLVGYRDRGDAYITTLTALSDDLDAVYTQLMRFQANGGGDTPESVNQALYEAVTKTDWSDRADTYRVIFLVGDAPPHMDYQNDTKYAKSCRMAAKRGIIINTIQCGSLSQTTPIWREIAQMGEGQYFRVAQAGSAVLYETPYDEEIARLSRDLDATRLYYGAPEELEKMERRKKKADTIYEAAAPSALAKRAIFNAQKSGAKNFLGSQELIHDLETGIVDLDELRKEELPPELRGMNKAELEDHLAAQKKRREALQAEIEGFANKRQSFIEEKVKAEKDKGTKSLDVKIYECIRTQAASKDILYKDGPKY